MNTKKKFFIISMPIIMAICSLFLICDYVDAAPRTAVRSAPATRKSVPVKTNTTQNVKSETTATESEPEIEIEPETPEFIIENKSNQFDVTIDSVMESDVEDNSFAEQIRKQRAALAASESATNLQSTLKSGKNSCDGALRECMMKTCGNDFTKCALDGDTIFGDKLNKCRRNTECSAEEFKLFTAEIKADRDTNVKLASYNAVLNCGNAYNACIINECGAMFTNCLGKTAADAAIKKCSTIAKDCTEYDSGLASRFGTVIGKLRENAEKDIKKDEETLYALREKMANQCKSLGAMFDERTFDCVYTVSFFAGDDDTLMASRKLYAGQTFKCTQEWFGVNTTTYKENAYRETRAQTAASSAMLGAGIGTAAGLATSGAIGRSIDTQKAKKAKETAEKGKKTSTSSQREETQTGEEQGEPKEE